MMLELAQTVNQIMMTLRTIIKLRKESKQAREASAPEKSIEEIKENHRQTNRVTTEENK